MLLPLAGLTALFLFILGVVTIFKVVNVNKLWPFECGFTPIGVIQISYTVHFYIILMIFILFDLEVVLLLGSVVLGSALTFHLIIDFIIGSIYLEWGLGKLKWIV